MRRRSPGIGAVFQSASEGSSAIADNAQFYRQRATMEQANADAASLDNVRDRCDRAAKAWSAMAERAERTQSQRAAREAATDAARIDADPANPQD